jgi:hypothetical protein
MANRTRSYDPGIMAPLASRVGLRPTETTAPEVIATFAVTAQARTLLQRWRTDPDRQHVVSAVLGHTTRRLYRLDQQSIERAGRASEHPLGGIRKETAMAVQPVVDWRPDFAFTHVMHFALEEMGQVPTFQAFARYCGANPLGRKALGDPAREITAAARRDGYSRVAARQAVRWRIGLAYYSFLRELYVITVLRSAGLDVRAHPLADALFRADAWTGRTVLSLYIRNGQFRDGSRGRKLRINDILAGAQPPFSFTELRLSTQHQYGCVHLPAPDEITALALRMDA